MQFMQIAPANYNYPTPERINKEPIQKYAIIIRGDNRDTA